MDYESYMDGVVGGAKPLDYEDICHSECADQEKFFGRGLGRKRILREVRRTKQGELIYA